MNYGEADCSRYTGTCHHRCKDGCEGATAFDCVGDCVANAYVVSDECVCMDGWTGEDCSVWMGECAPTCMECTGPTANECVRCVEHGYRIGGTCVCMPGWEVEADCSKKEIVCHVSCKTGKCTGEAQNECTECYEGFVLDDGFCLPCHEECRECSGTEANECTECFAGRAPVAGVCECCHLTCNSCTGTASNNCSSCHFDSRFDGFGNCICNNKQVRLPEAFGFGCVDNCPFGYTPNGLS